MKEPTIVFLDTETTGIEATDRLVQVSYKVRGTGETDTELFSPPEGVELTLEATSVHHITKKMLADKPFFANSKMKDRLNELFKSDTIMVAHNAMFDIGVLKMEGLEPHKFICTLKVARFLDPKAEMTNYKLQYLRYAYDLDVEGKAHDAEGDVAVLEKLFEHFSKTLTIQEMLDISAKPSFIRKFPFGKYKGELVADVSKKDRDYIRWFLETKKQDESKDEDWIYTLNEVLK
jgi:DNA polymerase III epsilon subunit-like protein